MILCVNLFWPSKITCSLVLMQNMFNVWVLGTKRLKILFLEDLDWIQVFLKKLLNSYSCISFMNYGGLSGFYIKLALFFKNFKIPYFWSIKAIARSIEIALKILVWICLARLVLNWCSIDRIYFLIDRSSILTDRNSKSECFKKVFLTCSSLFSNLFKNVSHFFSSTDRI